MSLHRSGWYPSSLGKGPHLWHSWLQVRWGCQASGTVKPLSPRSSLAQLHKLLKWMFKRWVCSYPVLHNHGRLWSFLQYHTLSQVSLTVIFVLNYPDFICYLGYLHKNTWMLALVFHFSWTLCKTRPLLRVPLDWWCLSSTPLLHSIFEQNSNSLSTGCMHRRTPLLSITRCWHFSLVHVVDGSSESARALSVC